MSTFYSDDPSGSSLGDGPCYRDFPAADPPEAEDDDEEEAMDALTNLADETDLISWDPPAPPPASSLAPPSVSGSRVGAVGGDSLAGGSPVVRSRAGASVVGYAGDTDGGDCYGDEEGGGSGPAGGSVGRTTTRKGALGCLLGIVAVLLVTLLAKNNGRRFGAPATTVERLGAPDSNPVADPSAAIDLERSIGTTAVGADEGQGGPSGP